MSDWVRGRVRNVGERFGFVADESGAEFYFTTERLSSGLRLWPGDVVEFVPLARTAGTSRRPGGRPLATMIRRLESEP